MTDLPDAETEQAAWDEWNRWGDSVTQTPMIREAHRAGFAAASGPWSEQLDAAKAERDEALLRLKRIIELEPVAHAAEQIRESDGSFTTEIAGVRLEKCDEYGRTKTTTALAAALARNTELQAQRDAEQEMHAQDCAENSRLRAELDNLRDRVNALAHEWDDCAYAYHQSDPLHHTYKGLANRLRAAIVRGSDDAGDDA